MSYNKRCNYLSASDGGRPIDCLGDNSFVLLHTVGSKRKEQIWLHASNIDVTEREVLIYVGGQDAKDVSNFKVAADDTKALFAEQPIVLGKGKSLWAKVATGNVNIFGRVEIC